jgi:GTP-binding protein HflX
MEDEEEEFAQQLGISAEEEMESTALLVGSYTHNSEKEHCLEHLDELERLADTFGVPVKGKIAALARKFEASTFLPRGKIDEIAQKIEEMKTNLVIFDDEISPAQQRNLEKLLKVAVMDRTELILEIFAQRAQTKEARLQIELARTKYEFPRLKRLWSHFSRQRARGGYLKGEGEKQIEIDRRLLKKKLERLAQELKEVQRYRQTQSSSRRRSGLPTFAIVGYTNAGKSTLLNALTEAHVFVEDKLFATLDPTTRKFVLPNRQEILLTDTVGFIRKLPHTLVAAFRSTLEAALHDDVLLHLIDVSNPQAEEHAKTTHELLKELDAKQNAVITVLNKVDLCPDRKIIDKLKILFPKTVEISALQKIGFNELTQAMMLEMSALRSQVKLKIPQSEYVLVAMIKREGKVLYEEYGENYIMIRAEIPVTLLHRFDPYREDDSSEP